MWLSFDLLQYHLLIPWFPNQCFLNSMHWWSCGAHWINSNKNHNEHCISCLQASFWPSTQSKIIQLPLCLYLLPTKSLIHPQHTRQKKKTQSQCNLTLIIKLLDNWNQSIYHTQLAFKKGIYWATSPIHLVQYIVNY